MNQKQIQALAFEYIRNRVESVYSEIKASDDGIANDEAETFIGWFNTYEDFKEWALNDSNWNRDECANLHEIHNFITKVLHC